MKRCDFCLKLCAEMVASGELFKAVSSDDRLRELVEGAKKKCVVMDGEVGASLCESWILREPADKRWVLHVFRKQFASLSSLTIEEQGSMVRILPAIVSRLKRIKCLQWIGEATWASLLDSALFTAIADKESNVVMARVTVVQCLLSTRQLRVIHSASPTLRALSGRWMKADDDSSFQTVTVEERVLACQIGTQLKATLGIAVDTNRSVVVACRRLCEGAFYSDSSSLCRPSISLAVLAHATDANAVSTVIGDREDLVRILFRLLSATDARISVMTNDRSHCQSILLALVGSLPSGSGISQALVHRDMDTVDVVVSGMHELARSPHETIADELVRRCEILGALCTDTAVVERLGKRRAVHQWIALMASVRKQDS